MAFPKDFVWGAATSSYQIEGGAFEDGKGPGIWDVLCKRDGAIWQKHTGDVACDHYHRYAEDVAIMKDMGLKAYRMETSWPRIMPQGVGAVNQKGIDFYDKLIDELLKADIKPWVTLYHWNLPQALQEKGGWQNPDSAKWFENYTALVVQKFSDRVTDWMTINEPQVIIMHGLITGCHAPGFKLTMAEALSAGHNLLLAHGRSVIAIRQNAKKEANVGYAPVGWIRRPVTNDPRDIDAAHKASFEVDPTTLWNSAWWMDPVFFGKYPEQGVKAFGKIAPKFTDDDMKIINQELDFLGVNIYTATAVKAGTDGEAEIVYYPEGYQMNTLDWPIVPDVLYWAGKFFYERYKKPLVITENGTALSEIVARDGSVLDPQRSEFIAKHLIQMDKAIQEGVPYKGYFYWSLLDNFEWHQGYRHRFGLVYVDFETGERIVKESARFYGDVIAGRVQLQD